MKPSEMTTDEGQQDEIVESKGMLLAYRERFMGSLRYNIDRAERVEALMARKSAQKWNAQKKQKMVRRLVNARTTASQLEPMIDQINVRLHQISD